MGHGARAGIVAMILAANAAAGAAPRADESLGEKVDLAPAGEPARPHLLVGTRARPDSGELDLRLTDGRAASTTNAATLSPEGGRAARSRWHRGLKGAAIGAAAALTATLSWWALTDDPEKDLGLGFGLFLYTPAAAGLGLSIGLALPPAQLEDELSPPRASLAAGLRRHAPRGLQLSLRF